MRIVIFGATGGVGNALTEQALAQGHQVTAFVRNPAGLTITHKNLSTATGSVLDLPSVERAIANHDAVLWAVGGHDAVRTALAGKKRESNLCTNGTQNILAAMQKQGVRTFICLTSWGVGDSKQRVPFFFRNVIMPLILKPELVDKERQEELIRQSGLDWVIVRASRLTNDPASSNYRSGEKLTYTGSAKISRADVAAFMLQQLTNSGSRQKTLEVSS